MPDGMQAPKRRSKLLAVAPELVEPKKPKVLVYGPPGVGKTWAALDFPGVYYFDHERGADLNHYRTKLQTAGGVYFGPDQGSLDFETVIGQVQALATEPHEHRTMVFDSITKLFNTSISEESDRIVAKGSKDEFGASKKPIVRQMARLVRWVNAADMNAIFICHQKELWGKDDKGQREAIGWTFDGWEKLEYELHLILRISKIGQGDGAKRFAHIGKSRLTGFPEGQRFDWSYADFAERYGRDVIERETKQLVLATDEQVSEVKRLLETVKVSEDFADKCFKKAGTDDWSEMESDTIGKVVDALKAKLAT